MSRPMNFIFAGCVAVAGIVLLAWMFQRTLIYFPLGNVPAPSEVGLADIEAVEFPTADGLMLNAWFVRSASSAPAFTVLVLNGNAGNRAYRAPLAASLQQQGVQVLLFDYRGYGGNEGTPTEAGLRADARAARTPRGPTSSRTHRAGSEGSRRARRELASLPARRPCSR